MTNKEENGQFKKGYSGNPGGKPKEPLTSSELTKCIVEHKNNRNQFTLSLFRRIESTGDQLADKAIEMALEGNEKMMMFILDKLINPNLMNRLEKKLLSKTVADIDNSQQFVIEKMGDGELDVNYGQQLVKTLSLKRDTIDVKVLESEVRKIVNSDSKCLM
jgi:hypothetical protein